MKAPFTLHHVAELSDGTGAYLAVDIKPGFTSGDLIDYVQTQPGKHGTIKPICFRGGWRVPTPPDQVVEYAGGKLTNTFIVPNKPVQKMDVYVGYGGREDYEILI